MTWTTNRTLSGHHDFLTLRDILRNLQNKREKPPGCELSMHLSYFLRLLIFFCLISFLFIFIFFLNLFFFFLFFLLLNFLLLHFLLFAFAFFVFFFSFYWIFLIDLIDNILIKIN